jgi:hypothetical protein
VAHVVAGIEVRIVDPHRSPLRERRPRELLPVARHEVQARLDFLEELWVARWLALEDQHGADMHVRAAALQRQERRVEAAQAVRVRHRR